MNEWKAAETCGKLTFPAFTLFCVMLLEVGEAQPD
jgi:hypothetical protein